MKPKPFIKWAGGKQRMLKYLVPHLPEKISIYCEPFLGAGSMAIHIADNFKPCMILGDINPILINTWKTIAVNSNTLIDNIKVYEMDMREDLYLIHRNNFNSGTDRTPWNFIYLLKAGFNGLYRVNSSGIFNVPFGDGKQKKIIDEKNILELSQLFRNASFSVSEAEITLSLFKKKVEELNIQKDEHPFVYLDPPYRGSSFNYSRKKFNDNSRIELKDYCKSLCDSGIKVMLSEADDESIKELWSDWNISEIQRPGTISSDSSKRGKVTELIIKNY